MIKCVGCLIYDKDKNMFLLQQRSKTSSHPLKWGFWGGKLEKGEDFAQGLKREIKEELGTYPEFDKLFPLDVFLSDDRKFVYYSFVMVVDRFDDFKISSRETNDFIWLPLNCIEKIDIHQGLKKTLKNKYYILEGIVERYKNSL
jgi:8-oxo-dGTP pyrophosphatase MutT (NUDIX family)